MKKLLGVLLVAVMSWPTQATVLKNVEVVGEIQTIASDVAHNPTEGGLRTYNSGTNVRVLAGLSADLVEDVTANLLFQYNNVWGNDGTVGKNLDGYWNDIRLAEANVAIHNLFCAFDLKVGRQFYGDEDSAIIYFGPNHYNAEMNFATSLDAAKLVYADDSKAFTVLAGTLVRNDAIGGTYNNRNDRIFGADLKLNLTEAVMAQVYGYDVTRTSEFDDTLMDWVRAEDKHNGVYGAKLGLNVEAFRVSAEYARNFGGKRLIKEHNPTGHMFKADIAADIDALTARGTFLYANDNFFAWGNYTPGLLIGHPLGGAIWDYSDDGVRMFNLGFDMKAAEKWIFSLDGFAFQDSRGHRSATWEADLTAKYNHNDYVQLFAGVGYAKAGMEKDVETGTYGKVFDRDDNVKGQIGMLIKF